MKQISKLPSSSESPSSSNDESNQKTTRKQEVIKNPDKNNIALLSPPKGKQLAAKPLNQTSDDGSPSSSKSKQAITSLATKRCSQSPECENEVVPSKMLKLLNSLKEDNTIIKQRLNAIEGKNDNHAIIIQRLNKIEQKFKASVSNSIAKTDKRNAYQALKSDWIPTILTELSAIRGMVQEIIEDK